MCSHLKRNLFEPALAESVLTFVSRLFTCMDKLKIRVQPPLSTIVASYVRHVVHHNYASTRDALCTPCSSHNYASTRDALCTPSGAHKEKEHLTV